MNKSLKLIFFYLLIASCNDVEKTEYYEDGSVKSLFKGNIETGYGEKINYNRNGQKRSMDFIVDNQIDSSVYYFEGKDDLVRETRSYNDSTVKVLKYNQKSQITVKGSTLKDNADFKIGKWVYTDHLSKMDSIVEFIDFKNKSYANQIWLRTSKGDTVYGRGNYLNIRKKDTISVEEVNRVQITLMEPALGVDSDIIIVIPKKDEELKENYSNLFEIQSDTLYSIKNDGIPRQGIPEKMPINHIAEFGLQYSESGKRRIRGVVIEYFNENKKNNISADTKYYKARRLFFDESLFVK